MLQYFMRDFKSRFFSFMGSAGQAFNIWKHYSELWECLIVFRMAAVWQRPNICKDGGLGRNPLWVLSRKQEEPHKAVGNVLCSWLKLWLIRKSLQLEKTFSPQVLERFSPVYLCWFLSSLRSSRVKVRLCLPDVQQGNCRAAVTSQT